MKKRYGAEQIVAMLREADVGLTERTMSRSKIMRTLFAAAAVAALLALPPSVAPAATLYWSGTGTWDTTSQVWGTTTGGPYTTATWDNATPDSAIFEGTAGTVTLGEAITFGGMIFDTAGYTIANGARSRSRRTRT